jgi:hypothetical protein
MTRDRSSTFHALVDRLEGGDAHEQSGFERRHFADGVVGFDTHAAVDVGRQVWRELAGSALTPATR